MVSSELIEIILKAQDQASSTAEKVDGQMEKIGESANNANQKATSSQNSYQQALAQTNSKLSESSSKFNEIGSTGGSAFQKVSSKVVEVGNKIKNDIGNKWDTIKGKVTGFGSHIKSSLTGALSTVRSKIEGLGNAFSGLGGMMSSVFGGIGLKSLGDMTIGASISRDRIFNLSHAILGAGESAEDFKNKSDSLWNQMDSDTNKSLVGLDQISQAMSVINMSANASKDQLKALEPVILDIGQRAILMGKSGDEAVGLMEAAGKGLNGEFEMLRENLGITKDKLEAAGWSGAADDIDGYTQALSDCLSQSGDVSDMMNTTSGKLTVLKKYWGLTGRSIGDDFLPYLDGALTGLVGFLDADHDGALDARGKQWLQYGYGVMAAGSAFATAAPQVNNVLTCFDNLMGIMKNAGGMIRSVGSALGIMSSAEELAGAAAGASAAGHAAAATAEEVEAGAAATASVSTWSLVWPVLALIAAFVAIAVVIYEVGKAFGWWTDVGTMIEAISSGIQRMWDAFINNPDVQDLLKGISDGFSWIVAQIGPVIQGILEFLGVSTDGDFDIVHTIIMLAGNAFHFLADMVRAAIPYLQSFYNDCLVPLAGFLSGVFTVVWSTLMEVIEQIIPFIGNMMYAFQAFQDGQIDLPYLIQSIMVQLLNIYSTILSMIITAVVNFAMSLITAGISAASNFVNGIITWLSQLPGQAWTWLVQTSTRITTAGMLWVNKARAMASQLVTGVISWLRTLPGRVYSALIGVVSRISSAIQSWISTAKSKVSTLISNITSPFSGVASAISSALSGVVSAIKAPFEAAYNAVKPILDKIKQGMDFIGGITGAAGFELGNAAGFENSAGFELSDESNVSSTTHHEVLDVNYNINIDLTAPSGMSSNDLMSVVNDRDFLVALTGNRDFQELDARVKSRISLKNSRMRGV